MTYCLKKSNPDNALQLIAKIAAGGNRPLKGRDLPAMKATDNPFEEFDFTKILRPVQTRIKEVEGKELRIPLPCANRDPQYIAYYDRMAVSFGKKVGFTVLGGVQVDLDYNFSKHVRKILETKIALPTNLKANAEPHGHEL